jgi:hypothetical protein
MFGRVPVAPLPPAPLAELSSAARVAIRRVLFSCRRATTAVLSKDGIVLGFFKQDSIRIRKLP